MGLATWASDSNIGILNQTQLPTLVKIIASVLILDLAIYIQHVVFHRVPILWKLHRMHHADLDLDVTSGSRFHPIEIIMSMCIKLSIIVLIGAPAVATLIFEIVLNAAAMFNHGNIYIPSSIDRVLRLFLVTPDMHRVHHSVRVNETNSNYGFNLPIWDRLFHTYKPAPQDGQLKMTIGLPIFRDPKYSNLQNMLKIPFKKVPGPIPGRKGPFT